MKSMGGRTPVFYFFQQDANRDYNVTTLAPAAQPPIIRDVLATLPLDLSQGLYHFRFKSEMPQGDEKIVAWIDINNLAAKVPQINGAIYVKILKLKESAHNKLFHVDKLRKADLVKQGTNSHSPMSAPRPAQNTPSPQPRVPTTNTHIPAAKTPNAPVPPQNVPLQPRNPTNPPATQPVQKESIKQPPVAAGNSNLMTFESPPPPPPRPSTTATVQQNLQIFKNQFKQEQQHRQNERIAQEELQDKLRKWGYTDLKKINNTTTLLATLHQIWPEWQQVSLTDMLKPEQVASLFKKAVIKVHPDKNRNRHFKERYLSKRVFELLNESRKQ